MEPMRGQDPYLSPPDGVRPRSGPSPPSRAPYQRVSSFEDDIGDANARLMGNRSPPILPTISEMTGLPAFGLGIRDSQGQFSDSHPGQYAHSRSASDPFGDPKGTTRDEYVRFPSFKSTEISDEDSTGVRSHPTAVDTPPATWDTLHCPSRKSVTHRRTSWFSINILFLSFYSTALSGAYLVAALVRPRWGRSIGYDGGLALSTASLLTAFFAKTIELSFVTVFVAFLGQVLSRRSLTKSAHGFTIAEMSMRSWVMQPGNLIARWQHVRYAGVTFLGMISLTAALMALLYTTAAETLVSPKLKFLPEMETTLKGEVFTKFANTFYLSDTCKTPIARNVDAATGTTCMQMYHVGQAYHNYQQYLQAWSSNGTSASTDLERRPPPIGTWYDNTTVTGSWIDVQDITEASKYYKRMVNNVTAAMPHAGVWAAAVNPVNKLRSPGAFGGQGEYNISASVPSPVVNVLCVGMTEDELEPIIYAKWPYAQDFNASQWNSGGGPPNIPRPDEWNNKTVVDDLFGFGPGTAIKTPFFPKLPEEFNTLINVTGDYPADIYLLGASPKYIADPPYVFCALKGGLTTKCSTQYYAAANSGQLVAHCADDDPLAYHHQDPEAPPISWDPDWKNVGSEWAKSINLADGLTNGQSSNARLLTHFIPPFDRTTNEAHLQDNLPSTAEALAALAGSTLLISTLGSQLKLGWPFETAYHPNGSYFEEFSATIQVSDYASGAIEPWQNIFFIVLASIFLTNLVCLVYFYFGIRGVQLTDFTEPQNVFALALNSPPSTRLSGACGGGPEGPQLNERWVISMDEHGEHYMITSKAENPAIMRATTMKSLHLSPNFGLEGPLSPAVTEYRRISQTKGTLTLLKR
ncbi:hypothetical protein VTO42DRAFT_8341 [Malbranchea cinnamomea]